MYRKWMYAPIVAIAALGLIAATGFAAGMSSKKSDSAQEYMGKGVGAMQGKERPPEAVPEPATSAEPSERAVRQEISKEAEGGVGAMQGKEDLTPAVPESATSAEPSEQEVRQEISKEAEGGVGAMQGKERPPQAVPEPATKSPR
jgi:hypothetical protein